MSIRQQGLRTKAAFELIFSEDGLYKVNTAFFRFAEDDIAAVAAVAAAADDDDDDDTACDEDFENVKSEDDESDESSLDRCCLSNGNAQNAAMALSRVFLFSRNILSMD